MQYKILVSWEMTATLEIEAATLDEALEIAEDTPLPDDGDYVDNSFAVLEDFARSEYPE